MTRFPFKTLVFLVLIAGVATVWKAFRVQFSPPHIEISERSLLFRGGSPEVQDVEPLSFDVAFSDLLLQAQIEVHFSGNGRETLKITVLNRSEHVVLLKVKAGQVFKNINNSVVILRDHELKVEPGKTEEQELATAALSSRNHVGSAGYTTSVTLVPKLNLLLSYLQYHEELSPGAIQTAVLALTENLPASAFARYSRPDADLPSLLDTTSFRVDTSDLISALITLRDIGIPESELALTVDPQLKSEAMIDPLAHALALQYYKIPFENEWSYWKNELLQGDPAIRHYALYGIARFYPDIALEMLPKWARASNLSQTYRESAIRALAETGRTEALSVLQQFEFEFGGTTQLGKVAHEAASYLDARLNQDSSKIAIRFQTTNEVSLRAPIVEIGVSASKN